MRTMAGKPEMLCDIGCLSSNMAVFLTQNWNRLDTGPPLIPEIFLAVLAPVISLNQEYQLPIVLLVAAA